MSDDDAPRRRGRPPSGGREAMLRAALELMRERGAGRLTTKEVAARAGVSEGSVFYHFTDRSGLLLAVIESGVEALRPLAATDDPAASPEQALERFARGVEGFLDTALVVIMAAQSDAELRSGLIEHLRRHDMGPHRGVQLLAGHLRAHQEQGSVRDDVEAEVLAFLFFGACFQRVFQTVALDGGPLPDRSALVAGMTRLLTP